MDTVWIVVAHHSGARLFKRARFRSGDRSFRRAGESPLPRFRNGVRCIKTWDHPEGRLHDRELSSDLPGRAFSSIRMRGGSGVKHAYTKNESPSEHAVENFAVKLARELDRSRGRGDFDYLVLVAEPSMLGMLRNHMSSLTEKSVLHSLSKNLSNANESEVALHVDGPLRQIEQNLLLSRKSA